MEQSIIDPVAFDAQRLTKLARLFVSASPLAQKSSIVSWNDGDIAMTYVVTDSCIKCKYMDCLVVCPVNCFYEGQNMLVISPEECIDCGVCVPECPVDAIKPDSEPDLDRWVQINADYAKCWPNVTVRREPPDDAKQWELIPDKFATCFSAEPGLGD